MEEKHGRQGAVKEIIRVLHILDIILAKRTFSLSILAIAVGAVFHRQLVSLLPAVPYVFALMTLSVAMGCSWRQFGTVAKNPFPLLVALFGLHVIGPVMGKLLGSAVFGERSLLTVGLVLGMAVPTGTTSVMWAGIAEANLPLSISIVALDALLSPVVVPVTLQIFAGESVTFDALGLLTSLCFTVVLPTTLGVSINDWSKGRIPQNIKWLTSPFVKLGLFFVIAVNIAGSWLQIVQNSDRMVLLLGSLLLLAGFGYWQGIVLGRLVGKSMAITKSLTFSVGMRNISAGIVIAMTYFPPEVAIPVVAATLFQQPLATLVYRYFLHEENKAQKSNQFAV